MAIQLAIVPLLSWLAGSAAARWVGTKLLFFFLFTVVLPLVLVNVIQYFGGLYFDRILEAMAAGDSVPLQLTPLGVWLFGHLRIVECLVTMLTIGLTSRLIRTVG